MIEQFGWPQAFAVCRRGARVRVDDRIKYLLRECNAGYEQIAELTSQIAKLTEERDANASTV